MSFNPVSEWVPPKQDDVKPSVEEAAGDNLEVPQGKRIGRLRDAPNPQHVLTQ